MKKDKRENTRTEISFGDILLCLFEGGQDGGGGVQVTAGVKHNSNGTTTGHVEAEGKTSD